MLYQISNVNKIPCDIILAYIVLNSIMLFDIKCSHICLFESYIIPDHSTVCFTKYHIILIHTVLQCIDMITVSKKIMFQHMHTYHNISYCVKSYIILIYIHIYLNIHIYIYIFFDVTSYHLSLYQKNVS